MKRALIIFGVLFAVIFAVSVWQGDEKEEWMPIESKINQGEYRIEIPEEARELIKGIGDPDSNLDEDFGLSAESKPVVSMSTRDGITFKPHDQFTAIEIDPEAKAELLENDGHIIYFEFDTEKPASISDWIRMIKDAWEDFKEYCADPWIYYEDDNEKGFKTNEGQIILDDSYWEPTVEMWFCDDEGEIIGKLLWETGKLVFEGDAEESAKVFFEHYFKALVDGYIEKRLEDKKKKDDLASWLGLGISAEIIKENDKK